MNNPMEFPDESNKIALSNSKDKTPEKFNYKQSTCSIEQLENK